MSTSTVSTVRTVRTVRTQRLRPLLLSTSHVSQAPHVMFHTACVDLDGDGVFNFPDLRALSKRHFTEHWSLGDGHCFFRVLHRFLRRARLYTLEETEHFRRVRSRVVGNAGIFPEIAYLRRLSQKFCNQIAIDKYGRKQSAPEDAITYAAASQEYGLSRAKNLQGTGFQGYADSPDYEACAMALEIIVCILQTDGKWQVFPDDCLEKGFGNKPIMFAYNQGSVHFNALEPCMAKIQARAGQVMDIAIQMRLSNPTQAQACRIAEYFFNGKSSIAQIDKDITFIQRTFLCKLPVAVEMLRIRIPIHGTIQEAISKERRILSFFSEEMFGRLLTYGNTETRAGFKTAGDLLKYMGEKTLYLSCRDQRTFTKSEIADLYLKGD